MARPKKLDTLALKGKVAADKVRDKLPELADQLLLAAMDGKVAVVCPQCSKQFTVPRMGDARIAQFLWTQIEGKPPEQKPVSETDRLIDFFSRILDRTDNA